MSAFKIGDARFRVINQTRHTPKGSVAVRCVYRDTDLNVDDHHFLMSFYDERGFTLAELVEIAKIEFADVSSDRIITYLERGRDTTKDGRSVEDGSCRLFITEKWW